MTGFVVLGHSLSLYIYIYNSGHAEGPWPSLCICFMANSLFDKHRVVSNKNDTSYSHMDRWLLQH